MRKILICLLALFIILPCLVSCNQKTEKDGIHVICTTFAQYDWAREIAKGAEDIEISLLVSGGRDIHSYEPSTADLIGMIQADLLIYGGGSSEAWVAELIRKNELDNSLCLMEDLAGQSKLLHGAPHDHTMHGELCGDTDEHIWLSVKNAAILSRVICERLSALSPENASLLRSNLDTYLAKLTALDGELASLVHGKSHPTVVMADRYPFRYLFKDYGIECIAAFPGCSSESDASFDTVITLAKTVDSLALPGVAVIEGSDVKLATVVLENTSRGGKVFVLDSMQTLSTPESLSYLAIMQKNLEVLKELLG